MSVAKKILRPRQRLGLVSVCLLGATGVAYLVLTTSAAQAMEFFDALFQFSNSITLAVAVFFLKISLFFLTFIIQIAGYNGFLDSTAVNVGWVMVRDITNMFFVVILLVIAFGTILGLEQYEWKKLLVKFILAAILVNFSRIICGLIIDIAQVVMITFVNGVAATAGGNLINAFSADKILSFVQGVQPGAIANQKEVFVAATAALIFSGLMMAVMGVYVIMLAARLVTLWILIVLSPLAFVLGVIPQTQKYATQWWQEFGNNVVVGPIVVFFLWLSFVTVGSGNINSEIYNASSAPEGSKINDTIDADKVGQESAGILEVTTWAKMANFAIAIGMLLVGAKVAQQLGTVGGGMMGSAVEFGKKVAMIGSGVATGMWAYDKAKGGVELAKKGIGAAAYYTPYIGGEEWMNRFKNEWASLKNVYYGRAAGLSKKSMAGKEDIARMNSEIEAKRQEQKGAESPEEKARLGEEIKDMERVKGIKEQEVEREMERTSKGLIGKMAGRRVAMIKHLKKSEGQLEIREKMAFKRTAGDSGGLLFNRVSSQVRDQYRLEKGELEVEEARSTAKDQEYYARGKAGIVGMKRFRDRGFTVKENGVPIIDAEGKPARFATFADMIAKHGRAKGRLEEYYKAITSGAEKKIDVEAKIKVEQVDKKQKALDRSLWSDDRKKAEDAVVAAQKIKEQTLANIEAEFKPQIDAETALLNNPQARYNADVLRAQKMLERYVEDERSKEVDSPAEKKRQDDLDKQLGELNATAQAEMKHYQESLDKNRAEFVNEKTTPERRDELNKEYEVLTKNMGESQARAQAKLADLTLQKSRTAKEQQLAEDLARAEADRSMDLGYQTQSGRLQEVQKEKSKKVDAAGKDVIEAEKALTAQKTKEETELEKDPEKMRAYKEKQAEVAQKKELLEAELESIPGIGGYRAATRAGLAEAAAKAAKAQMQAGAMGLYGMDQILEATHVAEQLEQAGEKIKEKIKQVHLERIFKEGADQLRKATEAWKETGTKAGFKKLSSAAQAIKAEVESTYFTDLATTQRTAAKDYADTQFTIERFGYDTPSMAFKQLIKKRMDDTFQGVEREQGVVMALGSLSKLSTISKTKGQEALGIDQRAQMMANIQYLTKNGWSDDLLARICNVVNDREKFSGAEREQADALKEIFVDDLKWGREEDGGKILVNHSSGSRTNDLHRLMAYAGDISTLQSENAVLRMMRSKGTGYTQSAEQLADHIKAAAGGRELASITEEEWKKMAGGLGISARTAGKELQAFANRFVSTTTSATAAAKKFRDRIDKFSEGNEVLTDFKQIALSTAHIDDGGHTYYDMKDKIARGQLYDDAKRFMEGDWIKVEGGKRLGSLKIHSVASMDETTGTASYFDPKSWASTFAGAVSKIMLQKLDVRNQRLVVKLSADEEGRKDEDGRFIVGDDKSKLVNGTYQGDKIKAWKDIARDWAVALNNQPEVLMTLLGNQSGVTYEDAMKGKLRLKMGDGAKIDNVEQLMAWINRYRGSKATYDRDSKETFIEEDREWFALDEGALKQKFAAYIREMRDNEAKLEVAGNKLKDFRASLAAAAEADKKAIQQNIKKTEEEIAKLREKMNRPTEQTVAEKEAEEEEATQG